MPKSLETVVAALDLLAAGERDVDVATTLGVSRSAVRRWARVNRDTLLARRADIPTEHHDARTCHRIAQLPAGDYAYLLGLYLGDGWIGEMRRNVMRLQIACCDWYPALLDQCVTAVGAVMPTNRVMVRQRKGCATVYADSRHWPCLFPQHGPGRKHDREIALVDWQRRIVERHPRPFVAGLIHSDGSRCMNRITKRSRGVMKTYEYPRYFFANDSLDILNICGWALDLVGAEWRFNNWNSISVAKRASVALLDEFIGPKI